MFRNDTSVQVLHAFLGYHPADTDINVADEIVDRPVVSLTPMDTEDAWSGIVVERRTEKRA